MSQLLSQFTKSLEITHLPSLPHTLLNLMEVCGREEVSLSEIADIIKKDVALSAKVISVSNSAQFGRDNSFTTLEQKLSLLGLDLVQTIVISASVFELFSKFSVGSDQDLKAFWKQSLMTATLSKLAAKKLSYPNAEEAYLTGLLLNIGQLVLRINFPSRYKTLSAELSDGVELCDKEASVFGHNHSEIGAWLVGDWNMKSFISDAILYHHTHQTKISEAHPLIKLAYAANKLESSDINNLDMLEEAVALLGISSDNIKKIILDAQSIVIKVAKSLEIEIDFDTNQELSMNDNLSTKKAQLALEIRDVALIGKNSINSDHDSIEKVLLSIQQSGHILFDLKNTVFFLPDASKTVLNGKSLFDHTNLLNQMDIPIREDNSIVTRSFLTKSAFTSEQTVSILDEQIIRLMQSEFIYCQPLKSQSKVYGVAIFGLVAEKIAELATNKKLLDKFSLQAGHLLASFAFQQERESLIRNEVLNSVKINLQKKMHEANNPLSIIKNYLKLLGMKLTKDDLSQEIMIIKEEIDRVSRILRSVNNNDYDAINQTNAINLNDIISNLYKILKDPLYSDHAVILRIQLDEKVPNIETDVDKLTQVIINLVKNASEAMPNGGEILVRTKANVIHNAIKHIGVSVQDNGPGIPRHILQNLFKPVISSKGSSHSGLGLAIVKNILDELNGVISFESSPETGTTFHILLPTTLRT